MLDKATTEENLVALTAEVLVHIVTHTHTHSKGACSVQCCTTCRLVHAAGVQLPPPDYEQLTAALKQQCNQHNLQPTDYFLLKTIQLYEMIVVRHGLMLVGQPFSGKSSALTVLGGALSNLSEAGVQGALFNKVQQVVINPKAVTMGQLYGEFCCQPVPVWMI